MTGCMSGRSHLNITLFFCISKLRRARQEIQTDMALSCLAAHCLKKTSNTTRTKDFKCCERNTKNLPCETRYRSAQPQHSRQPQTLCYNRMCLQFRPFFFVCNFFQFSCIVFHGFKRVKAGSHVRRKHEHTKKYVWWLFKRDDSSITGSHALFRVLVLMLRLYLRRRCEPA